MQSVCEQYHSVEGVPFSLYDNTEDQILEDEDEMVTFNSNGVITLHDCLQKLSKELSNEVQFVLRTLSSDDTRVIEVFDKKDKKVADGDVQVDKNHGLLSVSGIDCVSGCVTTFIDGRCDDELCHLVLESELNPEANGRYYIKKKQYVGHYLGNEWYVKYFCSAKESQGTEEPDEDDED